MLQLRMLSFIHGPVDGGLSILGDTLQALHLFWWIPKQFRFEPTCTIGEASLAVNTLLPRHAVQSAA